MSKLKTPDPGHACLGGRLAKMMRLTNRLHRALPETMRKTHMSFP
jgi:hypothetical protein